MSTSKNPITESLRAALQEPAAPVQHKNGRWTVRDRKAAWFAAGPHVFDDHIERLGGYVVMRDRRMSDVSTVEESPSIFA